MGVTNTAAVEKAIKLTDNGVTLAKKLGVLDKHYYVLETRAKGSPVWSGQTDCEEATGGGATRAELRPDIFE